MIKFTIWHNCEFDHSKIEKWTHFSLKIYKLKQTKLSQFLIFFSHFEGTRGDKNQIFRTLGDQQSYLIKWLLDHDPSLRPTSVELLQSDYLPPPQVEEAELQEMVKHTLASRNSKSYRHLVDSCLGMSSSHVFTNFESTNFFHEIFFVFCF